MSADTGVIAGRVVDANGAPVKGATVTASSATQPVSDIASLTDGSGRFRRGELAPGLYTLTVMSAGHKPQNLDVNVAAGDITDVEIRLGGPGAGTGASTTNATDGVLRVLLKTDGVDWGRMETVMVFLRYDEDGLYEEGAFAFTARTVEVPVWQVNMRNSDHDNYAYMIVYVMKDGNTKVVDFTKSSLRELRIGGI